MAESRNFSKPLPGSCKVEPGRGIFVLLVLCSVFVVYFLFSLYVPFIGDDYSLPVDWLVANDGLRNFSWDGLLRFARYTREIDNARLTNVIFMAMRMSLAPKWTFALVVGLCAVVVVWGGALICTPRRSALAYVVVAFWGWMSFAFPWRFGTMGIDNSFNVFIPSVTIILFMVMMSRGSQNAIPKVLFLPACLFALIAGWMHEGFAVPMCCGLAVWCLLCRFKLSWQWWTLAVLFGLASVYVVSAPGLWLRFFHASSSPVSVNLKTLVSLILPALAFVIVAVVALAANLKSPGDLWLRFSRSQLSVLILVAFVVSAVIALKSSPNNPRALWICDLFASLAMFKLINGVFVRWSPRILAGLSGAMLLVIAMFYANVLRVQKCICDESCEIEHAMAVSPHGTVYRDYTVGMSKLTLLHPVNAHWRNPLHINNYNWFYPDGDKVYAVVPAVLRQIPDEVVDYINGDIDATALRDDGIDVPSKLPGSAGVFSFHDALLLPDAPLVQKNWIFDNAASDSEYETYTFECKDGRVFENMPAIKIRFMTPSGKPLIYIAPDHVKVAGPYESVSVVE